MPAKKRTTKNNTAPAAAPVTPAVTPETVIAAKKAAAEPVVKATAAKPAAKRPAARTAKAPKVAEAAVIEVPVMSETAATPERVAITEDDIRRQAYLLSRSRRGAGDPIADWFEAERQLREGRA